MEESQINWQQNVWSSCHFNLCLMFCFLISLINTRNRVIRPQYSHSTTIYHSLWLFLFSNSYSPFSFSSFFSLWGFIPRTLYCRVVNYEQGIGPLRWIKFLDGFFFHFGLPTLCVVWLRRLFYTNQSTVVSLAYVFYACWGFHSAWEPTGGAKWPGIHLCFGFVIEPDN